jgi:hypothetical protein
MSMASDDTQFILIDVAISLVWLARVIVRVLKNKQSQITSDMAVATLTGFEPVLPP